MSNEADSSAYHIGQRLKCKWKDESLHLSEIVEKRGGLDGRIEYYVHYIDYDKRLDEWVSVDRFNIDLVASNNSNPDALLSSLSASAASPSDSTPETPMLQRRSSASARKRKVEDLPLGATEEVFEKEHEQITKVRNIDQVQIGRFEVDTWYYSPYPDEYHKLHKLYVCEFCLKYMKLPQTLEQHMAECELRHPPGNEIYRCGNLSLLQHQVFEVDAKDNKIYCQNLCLFSKLFLDHKTLYYDVDPFYFYILCQHDDDGYHNVGYFSKEKNSPEDYNLACILVFPQYQRNGYGKFLISLSYELSRREDKVGSPEKPLSDLGKLSYSSYWTELLLIVLKEHGREIPIKDISDITYMKVEDIVWTLQSLNMIKYWKGTHIVSCAPKTLDLYVEQIRAKPSRHQQFDPRYLSWQPKVMPASGKGDNRRR